MPLDTNDLENRGQLRDEIIRRQDEIDFRDLIYGMAESVAHAQAALDTELAESMTRFAETRVDVIPRVVRTIRDDGTVVTEADRAERRSLLELGLMPQRYQFSEATVDVEFDLSFAVDETDTEDTSRKARFRVDTSEAHHRRRYHGEANTTAKISARLVPVPTPASLAPATVEAGGGGEGTDETGTETDETGTATGDEDENENELGNPNDDSGVKPADAGDENDDETEPGS
jgi:hypothetical protein